MTDRQQPKPNTTAEKMAPSTMHNSGNLATTIVFADKQLSELLMIKDFFDN